MEKREFEEMTGTPVSDEDYRVIEMVYMWHPVIKNTSGKDEVAELYKSFGMAIFYDMYPRAERAFELDKLLRKQEQETARIRREIEKLACPMG